MQATDSSLYQPIFNASLPLVGNTLKKPLVLYYPGSSKFQLSDKAHEALWPEEAGILVDHLSSLSKMRSVGRTKSRFTYIKNSIKTSSFKIVPGGCSIPLLYPRKAKSQWITTPKQLNEPYTNQKSSSSQVKVIEN